MQNGARTLILMALVGMVAACGGGTDIDSQSSGEKKEVVNQSTGLKVSASIAAATLGDYSANMQIAFFASEATSPASVEVVKVDLVDTSTGAIDVAFTPTSPQVWNGRSYEPWNQKVTPGGDLKASYQLTVPSGDSRTSFDYQSRYSTRYKLKVTLRIDGVDVTIESGELQREPAVAT